MSEWREVALGDVIELKRGYDLPTAKRREGSVPIVSSSGPTGFHDEAKVRGPGVVTGRYGTLGEVFYIEEDFWPLNTALYVRDFKGNYPRFVAALLSSLDLGRRGGAAAVPGVNRNHLHVLPVTIPEPETQMRIAEVLQTLDDLIENNRRRIALLEGMAQAIYREWFVTFRYPGHEDDDLVDSPLGPVPSGWRVVPMHEIAALHRHTVHPRHSPERTFEHFSIPNFDDGRLPAWEPGETIRSGKYAVAAPSVLVSKLNPRIPRVWLAAPTAPDRSIASTEFLVLRPNEWPLELFYLTLAARPFQEQIVRLSGGTSTSHQRAKPHDFMRLEVIEPLPKVIEHASEVISPMVTSTLVLRREAAKAAAIRDLLLPKLVTGAIDVSSLDLDALGEESAA